jgi:hypothetical protein
MTFEWGVCLRTIPWDKNDHEVAAGIAGVRTTISPSILIQIWQVRSLSASTQRINVAVEVA